MGHRLHNIVYLWLGAGWVGRQVGELENGASQSPRAIDLIYVAA